MFLVRSSRIKAVSSLLLDGFGSILPGSTKPHILIACMPKSASTYVATVISELSGMRRCRLTPSWGAREQELSQIRLSRYNHSSYVAQHHIKYSDWTGELIKKYRMTPVVMVRNLADCMVSAMDHYRAAPEPSPLATLDKAILDQEPDEFEASVIKLAIPWYLNFYVGWYEAGAPFFDYDDLTSNPISGISGMLDEAGLQYTDAEIETAIARCVARETRFNVGKPGRGENLSPNAASALLDLLSLYPSYQNTPLFLKSTATATAALKSNS